MHLAQLPALNASLNGVAALLLIAGYTMIRQRREIAHRNFMLAAFGCSVLFLISYVVYHYRVGSVPYQGVGVLRAVYFSVLISHVVLAAIVPFLALITLIRGLRGQRARHRKIARWTLPIWLYVSVTGVVVYWMLYG